jgi:hypothetical protein
VTFQEEKQMEVDKIEDSDDKDNQMAEWLDEDPNVESNEEEAGPSVEQPPVVVKQAVCGGDFPRYVVEAALVGSGDNAEAAPVGGRVVTLVSVGGGVIESPSVNGNECVEKVVLNFYVNFDIVTV